MGGALVVCQVNGRTLMVADDVIPACRPHRPVDLLQSRIVPWLLRVVVVGPRAAAAILAIIAKNRPGAHGQRKEVRGRAGDRRRIARNSHCCQADSQRGHQPRPLCGKRAKSADSDFAGSIQWQKKGRRSAPCSTAITAYCAGVGSVGSAGAGAGATGAAASSAAAFIDRRRRPLSSASSTLTRTTCPSFT